MPTLGQLLGIQKSIKSSHCPEEAWFVWEWKAVFNYMVVYNDAMNDTALGAEKIR